MPEGGTGDHPGDGSGDRLHSVDNDVEDPDEVDDDDPDTLTESRSECSIFHRHIPITRLLHITTVAYFTTKHRNTISIRRDFNAFAVRRTIFHYNIEVISDSGVILRLSCKL